ncbi:hypothetical protein CEXT_420011 [Caerostris extrusa]|uniref:Uncharacterized protein n=1 Tax=Caerostris extrusa TaxID=172846 RepID=A0AAV4XF72_CAEEX|nr:hypothetical protein CEXT_420011 [Caerostris extrusa]
MNCLMSSSITHQLRAWSATPDVAADDGFGMTLARKLSSRRSNYKRLAQEPKRFSSSLACLYSIPRCNSTRDTNTSNGRADFSN